jgi:diguanylate cyclase (GGDEF)-like protein
MFLTGSDDVSEKVRGFDLGAMDYVTKPFEPAELRARVRSALRTKRYQDLLASRAQIDGLTGLWNRAHFDRRIEQEMAAARRYGRHVALLMVDVDHFKKINDGFGHPAGDAVLQRVGEVLSATLRATDAPCRYGGEEFGVILTETDEAAAAIAARRVLSAIATIDLARRGVRVGVSASIGVAVAERMGASPTAAGLVAAADRALYAAKRAGRARVVVAGADDYLPEPRA